MIHSSRKSVSHSAFTLIELLVVIAIIALLAAILFPVFGRARENARRTACLSNLKQIGIGIMQYVQDYDERYPATHWEMDGNPQGYQTRADERGWAYNIQPYIKSTQVLQCPSEDTPIPAASVVTDTAGHQTIGYCDYAYNRGLGPISATNQSGVSAAELAQASNTVMALDYYGYTSGYSLNGNSSDPSNRAFFPPKNSTTPGPGLRHLDGLNYLFADGHAKWFKSASDQYAANVYDIDVRPSNNATFALK